MQTIHSSHQVKSWVFNFQVHVETQVKFQIIKTVTGVQNKQSQDGNICISYCYDILINQMINWFSDKIIGRL